MKEALCKECYQVFTDVVNRGVISNRGKCDACYLKWLVARDVRYRKKYKAKKPKSTASQKKA